MWAEPLSSMSDGQVMSAANYTPILSAALQRHDNRSRLPSNEVNGPLVRKYGTGYWICIYAVTLHTPPAPVGDG